MTEVGVRELKARASEIVRRVRETRESVVITYRGRAVARMVPMPDADIEIAGHEVLADIEGLAREIAAVWPPGVTAADAVDDQRRRL